MKRVLIWVAGGLLLTGGLVVALALVFSTKARPVPTELVGYHQTEISVDHRDVSLPVHIWYPTDGSGKPELIGQNALFYGEYAVRDAPQTDGVKPVVVVSHGSGGNAPRLGWLTTRLARSGFIVIGTNHPGATSMDSDPFQLTDVWKRAADVSALLDYLQSGSSVVSADMDRVTALGFSLGGPNAMGLAGLQLSKDAFVDYCDRLPEQADCAWTAQAGVDHSDIDAALYEQSNRDDRVGAIVLVDPAQTLALETSGIADMRLPTLLVNLGSVDVPPAVNAVDLADALPNAQYYSIDGPHVHFSFLAECSRLGKIVIGLAGEENICAERGAKPRGEIHSELVGVIKGFLEGLE